MSEAVSAPSYAALSAKLAFGDLQVKTISKSEDSAAAASAARQRCHANRARGFERREYSTTPGPLAFHVRPPAAPASVGAGATRCQDGMPCTDHHDSVVGFTFTTSEATAAAGEARAGGPSLREGTSSGR